MAFSRHARIGWVVAAVLLAAAMIGLKNRAKPVASSAKRGEISSSSRSPDAPAGNPQSAPIEDEIAPAAVQRVTLLLREIGEKFRATQDLDEARKLLQSLRDGIRQAPEAEAAAAILSFLKSGEDAPTQLPFVVGQDGMMATVPTLRTALLDLLPSLDPEAALEIAREIMDRRTSPDEYALGLRNLAWSDLDGDLRAELSRRFSDLLDSPWLDQPTAGVLESFDIPVALGGREMFDRMVTVALDAMEKTHLAASRAAFMSLDLMVLQNPQLLTSAVSGDAAWLDFAPQQRASLMSRLDLDDPAQLTAFTRYLASSHGAGELEYFAGLFPNGNFLYGHRLVTTPRATPTIAQITARDARVLAKLDALEATAPEPGKAAIRTIRERLRSSAKSAK